MWCPELAKVPNEYIHDPWNMPKALQKTLGVLIGGDEPTYPEPISCAKYTSAEAAKKMKRKSAPAATTGH